MCKGGGEYNAILKCDENLIQLACRVLQYDHSTISKEVRLSVCI